MAGLWLLQDLRMLNLAATSARGRAGGSNIKASYCPKALEQFQSWRKTPLNSVPPFPLLALLSLPVRFLCAHVFVCFLTRSLFVWVKCEAAIFHKSIALFEHCKSLVRSMKNAQLSFIDQKGWTNCVVMLRRYMNKCLSFSIAFAIYHFLARSEPGGRPLSRRYSKQRQQLEFE